MEMEMKIEGRLHQLVDDTRSKSRVQFENPESAKDQRSSFKTGKSRVKPSHRFRVNLC